jgi:hypothetical protein
MEGLGLPAHVAAVTFPRGCRIRRVRVPGSRTARPGRGEQTVIVSRRALGEARATATR